MFIIVGSVVLLLGFRSGGLTLTFAPRLGRGNSRVSSPALSKDHPAKRRVNRDLVRGATRPRATACPASPSLSCSWAPTVRQLLWVPFIPREA